MTHDGIHVDHGALAGATDDLQRTVTEIGRRLDRLESELAPLRSDWVGGAQQSYVVAKAAWDRAITEMQELLAETRLSVRRSDDDYRAADRRGAALFGG